MITSKDLGKLLKLFGPNGEAWTQNCFAKTADNIPVAPLQGVAVKWCLWGGCYKVGLSITDITEALKMAGVDVPKTSVEWNDSRKWEDVRSGLTKAMIFLKEREG